MSSRSLTFERFSCLEVVWDGDCFKKFEAFISIVDVTATHKYEVRLERTSPTTGHLEYKIFKVEDAIVNEYPQEVDLKSRRQQWTFPEGFADGNTIEVCGASLIKLSNIYEKSRCVSILEIDPKRFYAPAISRNIEHYRVFPRQDFAFNYFDEVLARRTAADTTSFLLKVFSFESAETGQRRFLVADYDSFFRHYSKDPKNSHHVYEIIRENVPCRAYFDLEYQIEFNSHLDGDSLTATWISLVIWKVFEIFKILLGKKDIIVLDSSTQKKYSKHVILIIPAATCFTTKTDHGNIDSERSEADNKEFLFRNNIVVGSLVNMIINDITHSDDDSDKPQDLNQDKNSEGCVKNLESGCDGEDQIRSMKQEGNYDDVSRSHDLGETINKEKRFSDTGNSPGPAALQTSSQKAKNLPNFSHEMKPKREYEALWVNKENGEKTCFVDLGVYTRNRAFRLWNSSKFGKNVPFKILREDKKRYKGLDTSNIGQHWGHADPNLGTSGAVKASCVRNYNLLRCFVIPLDIYEGAVVASGDNTEMERHVTGVDLVIEGAGSNEGAKRQRDTDGNMSSASKRSSAVISDSSIRDTINADNATRNIDSSDLDDGWCTDGRQIGDEGNIEDSSDRGTLLPRALLSDSRLDQPSISHASSSSSSSSAKFTSQSFPSSTLLPSATSAISPISRTLDLIPDSHEGPPSFRNLHNIFDFPRKAMKYTRYLHLPGIERNARYSNNIGHNGSAHTRGSSSNRNSWRNCEILRSAAYLQGSPFPAVDDFVARFVTKGGVQGVIGGWSLYSTPGPCYRLRYTVTRNRWCENVGRAHKSNGIAIEVDLTFLVLTQVCFDQECRGFRSEPVRLPPACCVISVHRPARQCPLVEAGLKYPSAIDSDKELSDGTSRSDSSHDIALHSGSLQGDTDSAGCGAAASAGTGAIQDRRLGSAVSGSTIHSGSTSSDLVSLSLHARCEEICPP